MAIPPQDLLMVLDVPQAKSKGTGVVTFSTVYATPALTPATTKSAPAASLLPRVIRAALKKSMHRFFSFLLLYDAFAFYL